VIWILLLAALFFVLVGGYFVGWFGTEHRLHPIDYAALPKAHESRSWFKVRAIALGLTLVIWILLLAALFFVLVGGYFVGWFGTEHRLHPIVVFVWKAIQWPATPRRGHQIPRTMPKAPANSQAASSGKYFNGTPMSS
jgi:hypothetical protein